MCRLYDADRPVSSLDLSKQLCDASFDSMSSYEEFENTLNELSKENLIEFTKREFTDEVASHSLFPQVSGRDVKREYEGFMITQKGVFVYRKQLVKPIQHIKSYLGKLSLDTTNKYKNIVEVIQKSTNIAKDVSLIGIASAPQLVQFIEKAADDLKQFGVIVQLLF